MDEVVEPVTPLYVHQVALTSINVPDEDGSPSLFPVIGVWADLSPLREGGVEFDQKVERTMPVVVITDSVLDATNPATMTILLAQAHDQPGEATDTDEDFSVSPFGPHWSARVPTTWVGMATVIMGSPLQMRMVLIDGAPPAAPESHLLTVNDSCVVVLPTVAGVRDTLAKVMGNEWTVPIPVQFEHHHHAPEVNLMRDQLWATIAGVSLGQERALNKAVSFAEWASVLNGGNEDEQDKYDRILEAAAWVAESSQLESLPRDPNGNVAWPAPMKGLSEKIGDLVDDTTLTSLDNGLSFEDAVDAFGFGNAMTALCVSAAAKANASVLGGDPIGTATGRFTPSYLLGMWLDEESDDPWWATRATHHLLLHHDTDVLVDLLTCNPAVTDLNEGHGPLTLRLFHVLTEVLSSFGLSPDEYTEHLKKLDVTPPRFDDIVYVSKRLLALCVDEANTDAEVCPGCAAVQQVVAETVDQHRLVQAAVGALPVLADLDAALNGLQVGDEDWKVRREEFLMHWMNHTAFHPSEEG